MQEKICLKRTGNTGHFMESERNLYEYSNSFRHHTSGICTTGSEYLRYGLSHHWIKSAIPHRTLKNIQLTTSHRGRLPQYHLPFNFEYISTHYLTQRQTNLSDDAVSLVIISTHYLTQRQTTIQLVKLLKLQISTHYLTQRQTIQMFEICGAIDISTHYLTQRQTGTALLNILDYDISTHYLTQRQTFLPCIFLYSSKYFNSLPHTEVDVSIFLRRKAESHFNSLPHTEVDSIPFISICTSIISTHYLTQRQTGVTRYCYITIAISTHYLTQRQTLPIFQNNHCPFYFNSLPHTEVDRYSSIQSSSSMYISTHYLTQRQTFLQKLPMIPQSFQLTTSHRGRRQERVQWTLAAALFQLTTSHRGRHGEKFYTMQVSAISTHYLTQRQTR